MPLAENCLVVWFEFLVTNTFLDHLEFENEILEYVTNCCYVSEVQWPLLIL